MLRTRFAVAALLGAAITAVAGGQDRAFTLNFKDKDGKLVPFYQEMNTDVVQHIKVQGQDLAQTQKSTFWYAWTPTKEEKVTEGKEEFIRWTIKQKVEGLRMNIDISGNPITYDSTKADQSGSSGNPGLIEFFKNLKDSEFTATLGKNYKVEKVEGKDAFVQKLGTGSTQMDALLKKVMSDDALKEMTDPTYKLLPEGPKKKDESWERKTNLELGPIGKYELTYKFTYMGPDKDKKDFDKIKVVTLINYTPPPETNEQLLFRIKPGSKLVSDNEKDASTGYVYYDPKNQRIDEAQIKIKLKGDLIVVIGGTDTKVELTQEQTTTIKTSDTSFIAPKTPPAPPPPPPTPPK